jgi:uncharacterized UBP type Zn finger protein
VFYDLKGIVVHLGEDMSSGHYISYVYDDFEKQWVSVNDDTVSVVSLSETINEKEVQNNCYILSYQKKTTV